MWESRLPRASIRPQPVVPSPGSRPRIFSKLLQLLVGDVVIAPDGLDVVVVLERVDQLHQVAASSPRTSTSVAGFQPSLALPPRRARLERLGDFVQRSRARSRSRWPSSSRFDILGAGLDRRFEHLVGIARAGAIFDQAHPLEAVADAARRRRDCRRSWRRRCGRWSRCGCGCRSAPRRSARPRRGRSPRSGSPRNSRRRCPTPCRSSAGYCPWASTAPWRPAPRRAAARSSPGRAGPSWPRR